MSSYRLHLHAFGNLFEMLYQEILATIVNRMGRKQVLMIKDARIIPLNSRIIQAIISGFQYNTIHRRDNEPRAIGASYCKLIFRIDSDNYMKLGAITPSAPPNIGQHVLVLSDGVLISRFCGVAYFG